MKKFSSLLLIFTVLVQAVFAQSDQIQSLTDIEELVAEFVLEQQAVKENINIDVRALDKRLRLSPCANEPQAQWSLGSRTLGRVTVQVSCTDPVSWRVHVQATVTLEGYVWALEHGARRGDVLDKGMLVRKKVMIGANNAALASLGNPIVNIEPWLGFTFSQRVSAGKVLSDRMLKKSDLVKKGEKVLITHRAAGLQLQTFGTALKGAASDQRIQVRNNSSGKIVEAVVVARGLVQVLH